MKQRRRLEAGYTLLEVMTVVALTGVMASLAVASMSPLRDRTGAQQGAEQVEQLLLLARKKAVASGRCYRVELTDASGAAVPAASPATAMRLRRHRGAGCDFPFSPGAPQPEDADFDRTEVTALPQGVAATLVAPEALDFLPSGRPRLPPETASLRVEVRYQGIGLWVEASPAGAVCVREVERAGSGEACP